MANKCFYVELHGHRDHLEKAVVTFQGKVVLFFAISDNVPVSKREEMTSRAVARRIAELTTPNDTVTIDYHAYEVD